MIYIVKMPTEEMRMFLMEKALCDVDDHGDHIVVSGDSNEINHIMDLDKN